MMTSDTWIDSARAVRLEDELTRRGIRLKGRVECDGPCPRCGGTDRFSINTNKQVWNCRGCGKGGDVIDLVQHLDGCNFVTAVEVLSGTPRPPGNDQQKIDSKRLHAFAEQHAQEHGQRDTEAQEQARRQLRYAEQLWRESSPTLAPEALDYFARRGIELDDVPEGGGLRWHPRCPWEDGTRPCVVARFTRPLSNKTGGIWRRPITGEKPKTLGPMRGGVIRLWPDDYVTVGLVIGEGVETTLAAATRIAHKGTLLQPAWATGCAANMAAFPVLAGIESLTILVDHDASGAGQRAAEECAQRWRTTGCEVIRLTPSAVGTDFADIVVGGSAP
jgi:phage/plasmid primase-like uncharacterized protein